MKKTLSLSLVLLSLFASSCAKEDIAAEGEETILLTLTKAVAENTGFSAWLFTENQKANLQQGKTGNYYSSGTTLIPGADGVRDISKGLVVSKGDYIFSLVSPVTELSQIPGTTYYGISYERTQATPYYTAAPSSVYITGISADSKYAISAGEMVELRSKVKVTVKCGSKVTSAYLYSAELTDVLDRSWYLPQTGEFYHSDATDEFCSVNFNFTAQSLESGSSVTSSVQPYVVSQDYSAVDKYSQPKYKVPKLVIKLGETATTQVTVPLIDNFRGQYTLHYTITVNSVYVTVGLQLLPWGTAGASGDVDQQPDVSNTITNEAWYPINATGTID